MFAALYLLIPTAAVSDSLWSMPDGSVLRLSDAGQARIIRHLSPSEEAQYAGEFPNATFFQGRINGSTLAGSVILRSEVCGQTTFPVRGQVEQDPLRITFTGESIVRDCLIPTSQFRAHQIVLSYIGPAE